jgi:hypothetical protein
LRNKILFFCIVVFVWVFSACKKNNKQNLSAYGKVVSSVLLKGQGTFRGFNLGDALDSVQNKEQQKPIEKDENFLYYEYLIDSSSSFNITYNFDEQGLSEIQSDIFLMENKSNEEIVNSFRDYFSAYFGEGESQKGFWVWTVQSQKYGTVRINLSDESSDFTVDNAPSKISLWIYPDKN